MSEEKSDVWDIVSTQEILERVCFEKPVTKEVAISNYKRGYFEDVIDQEVLGIIEVKSAE